MRILFLISSLNSGGAERVAATLCNAWAARGDSVRLVPTFSGGGEPFYEIEKGVSLSYLADLLNNRKRSGKNYFRRLMALRGVVRDESPDVVISFLPNVNVAAIAATAFTGIPNIICERSDPSAMPITFFWRNSCNITYRFAELLTVQTESARQSISRVYGGLDRIAVVPNPIPDGLLDFEANLASMRERKVLLSLGRLSEEKGIGQVISLFGDLSSDFPDWDLHIYGDGPERDMHLSAVERMGLSHRVLIKGRTSEPWKVMAAADAFVMNSRFEGFPNSLMESMGVGLPCITSDCASGPSEITRGGADALLFPSGDSSALRAALVRLMGDSDLRRDLGGRARQSVVDRYSLTSVLKAWDELFRQIGVCN